DRDTRKSPKGGVLRPKRPPFGPARYDHKTRRRAGFAQDMLHGFQQVGANSKARIANSFYGREPDNSVHRGRGSRRRERGIADPSTFVPLVVEFTGDRPGQLVLLVCDEQPSLHRGALKTRDRRALP